MKSLEQSVNQCLQGLHSDRALARRNAAIELQRLGVKDQRVLHELDKIARSDRSSNVREAAMQAKLALSGNQPPNPPADRETSRENPTLDNIDSETRIGILRSLKASRLADSSRKQPLPLRRLLQSSKREVIVGGAVCIVGVLVTIATIAFSVTNPSGGTILIAWGAIIFGAAQFFRGLGNLRTLRADLQERQTRLTAGQCPKCGTQPNPFDRNCPLCKIDLAFARSRLDEW